MTCEVDHDPTQPGGLGRCPRDDGQVRERGNEGTHAFIVSHNEGLFGADTQTVRFRQVLIEHQDYLRVRTDGAGLTYVR